MSNDRHELRMVTPSGIIVPMVRGHSENELWDRYAKAMNRSREDLEAAGYRVMWWVRPGRDFSKGADRGE